MDTQGQHMHQVPIPEEFSPKEEKKPASEVLADVFVKPNSTEEKRSWKAQTPKKRNHYYFSEDMLNRAKEKDEEFKINNMSRTIEILAVYALNILDANKKNKKSRTNAHK